MAVFLVPADQGRRIVLDKAVTFIGRHPDCDVVLTRSRKVSRRHCCIAQVNNRLVVRDLGSMNGVRINGERVGREAPLRIGDELSVGDVRYVLKAQPADSPEDLAERNGDSARPNEAASSDAKSAPRSHVTSPQPADLSQRFPVPIADESGEDVVVMPSINVVADSRPESASPRPVADDEPSNPAPDDDDRPIVEDSDPMMTSNS